MELGDTWSAGPVGDGETGRDDLLRKVEHVARGLPGGRVVTAVVVCERCGAGGVASDEFEVWEGECFCVGCLLPIDEDVLAASFRRSGALSGVPGTLTPSPTLPCPSAAAAAGYLSCPEGHGVFQVAVALALDPEASVRAVSVGLRCPEDGGLHVFLDNARMDATEA
ncbi:hypothetical protein ABZ958_27715 [Streptomyces sp. NPDC046237]|uniref:hypothetical protein n=1 Tax=Streptomyces sp. NPDC046237 TaxID=3154914 RepID=UPI0033DD41C3